MSAAQQLMMSRLGAVADLNPPWSNVVLALHGDGTNGSSTITDEKGHTITRVGTPTISTAQAKFGQSIAFSNGGITVGGDVYQADFDFGTGDFAFRAWVYQTTSSASQTIFDTRANGGSGTGFTFWLNGGKLSFYSGTTFFTADPANFPLNQWVHVEVSRISGKLWVFKNGVSLTANLTFTNTLSDGRCYIGQANGGGGGGFNWTGYIDDAELVKGAGLHTADFTPPSSAFPNS